MLKNRSFIENLIWLLTAFLYACFSITTTNVEWSTLSLLLITTAVAILTLIEYGFANFSIGTFHIRVIIFACYIFISCLWAINPNDAVERGLTVIELCACMTVFMWAFSNFKDPYEKLLKAVMWGGFIVVAYTFIFVGIGELIKMTLLGSRLESSFDNVNAISLICSFSLILSLYFMFKEKSYLVYTILDIPTIVLLSACGSRKSLVVAIIGSLAVYVIKDNVKRKKTLLVRLLVGVIITLVLLLYLSQFDVFSGVTERMLGLLGLFSGDNIDHSTLVRQEMAELGFSLFRENPLLGIGMSNAHIICYQKLGLNCYLHNNYAEILADGGIIGAFFYYSIHFDIILKVKRYNGFKSSEGYLILILLLSLLLSDLSMVSFYEKKYYFFFMIFYVYINHIKKQNVWERKRYC